MTAKLVEFPIQIPLTDVPRRLRDLAQRIENGEFDAIESAVVMLLPFKQFRPVSFCYGDNMNRHRMAGVLTHAAQMALTDSPTD